MSDNANLIGGRQSDCIRVEHTQLQETQRKGGIFVFSPDHCTVDDSEPPLLPPAAQHARGSLEQIAGDG